MKGYTFWGLPFMEKNDKIQTSQQLKRSCNYGEKKLIKLRMQVNDLHFKDNLSKSMIAKKKGVSRKFVIKWTMSPEQDFAEDNRGWQKGIRRKWTHEDERKIKEIFRYLSDSPLEFYCGATAIAQEWRKKYPEIAPPPLRTIGRILSDLNLSGKRRKDRHKGAARYLCYPEYTIYSLWGGRVMEADFIGKKYITGRTEPLNFTGFSFKKEPRLRYFKRIDGQTADNLIQQFTSFFQKFEKPDFVKVDNCSAAIGSISGKRNISRTMRFLLANQVIPIFAVPRKPFSQASIEGNNSVFSRKFWNQIQFESIEDVDIQLEWFNLASQRYTGYQPPQAKEKQKKKFIPKVYFIRQVKEDKELNGKAFISVLNEKIFLPVSYINYFVLAEWNLHEEILYVHFEKEQRSIIIKSVAFMINSMPKQIYS